MSNMLSQGWDSPYLVMALKRFDKLASDMEVELENSRWLAGNDYSLADADYTPYFLRMEDLGLDWLWETRSAIKDWNDRVRSRPSFSAVAIDWLPIEARQVAKAQAQAQKLGPRFRDIFEAA
eukprot:TRINITY_DN22126_c0_g1_i1.p1 TRINITY_DN22126_c0_g1~~TRINITY_DN22126_c0_g1_i1.p1  ORF type:complete len:122 (+),score=9.75 TRINITY_DN22126_c0_g1_i1:138-503(+)